MRWRLPIPDTPINEVSPMSFTKRLFPTSVLLCIGLAGCTPAHFVQRARPAPPCEVRVCLNIGAGPAQCECKSHRQVQRQMREVWGLRLE